MAMTIMNNSAAMMTLGEVNKNTTKLGKDLQKVANGQKINSAGDAASEYAISEKMRVQLRALNQDTQNVQNGSSLLRTALGGVDEIIDNLRSMKEMAINAANDTNTDADRKTIEKEFSSRRRTINDIATTTSYNGKTILDGTYALHEKERITGVHVYTEIVEADVVDLEPVILSGKQNVNIYARGTYKLADDFSGTIKVHTSDIFIDQQNPNTVLRNVTIEGPTGGNGTIRIGNLNIQNGGASVSDDRNVMKFHGSNNTLVVDGNNRFAVGAGGQESTKAVINVGGGLTVVGASNSASLYVGVTGASTWNGGAGIGSDKGERSTADITIGGGFDLHVVTQDGAGIGAGKHSGSIGNIYIANGANIKVDISNNVRSASDGAGIGSGYSNSRAGDIYIGKDVNIEILNRNQGAGVGSGGRSVSYVGNIYVDGSANIWDTHLYPSNAGQLIGAGYNSTAGTVYNPYNVDIPWTVPPIPDEETVYNSRQVTEYDKEITKYGTSLAIHSGNKQNQRIDLHISDMHSYALGTGSLLDSKGNFTDASDKERYDALSSNTKLQTEWRKTVRFASGRTVDDIDVTSRFNANVAVRVLDGALESALDEATNIGAYISRLEFTESNIVTANENTQASESGIRDADMAKAMTSYTKNNVLAQASQSMLAQANQSTSSVLSLLQ